VPGSLSNRPVAVAPPASGADDGAGAGRKNATTRQFAYDRTITQIKRARGQLHKLSVAVVLNNAAAPDHKAWNDAQVANIDHILRNGLGIDADRGDNLIVSAMAFPAKPAPMQWWQDRDTQIDIGTNVVYALGALLGFLFIVRPFFKLLGRLLPAPGRQAGAPALPAPQAELVAATAEPVPALGAVPAGAMALGAPATPTVGSMPVVPLLENYDLPPPGSPVDVMVDHLKVLSAKEPERVAEVVKQWVQKHGRTQ
jgi:flagellar M-ring protein FliF